MPTITAGKRATWGQPYLVNLILMAYIITLLNRMYGAGYPERFDFMMAPYGVAFRYAASKWGSEAYQKLGTETMGFEEDYVGMYHKSLQNGTKPLPFVFYVPEGYSMNNGQAIPNVKETDDPALIFTASFNDGAETWQKISFLSLP